MCLENKYLYHYMSAEEYKNYKNSNCIYLKQANSWNIDNFSWEDPILETFGIVGNKMKTDKEQLREINKFFSVYLPIYEKTLGIKLLKKHDCLNDSKKELYNKMYGNIFTDILNFIVLSYTTFVSCWTENEDAVGNDKVYVIKVKKDNLKKLSLNGYKITLSKMNYYEQEDMEIENRLKKIIDKDGVILKKILLQMPLDCKEEREQRIIATPINPKFRGKSFYDYIDETEENREILTKAVFNEAKEIKKELDKRYKGDYYGKIMNINIPKEFIEEEHSI